VSVRPGWRYRCVPACQAAPSTRRCKTPRSRSERASFVSIVGPTGCRKIDASQCWRAGVFTGCRRRGTGRHLRQRAQQVSNRTAGLLVSVRRACFRGRPPIENICDQPGRIGGTPTADGTAKARGRKRMDGAGRTCRLGGERAIRTCFRAGQKESGVGLAQVLIRESTHPPDGRGRSARSGRTRPRQIMGQTCCSTLVGADRKARAVRHPTTWRKRLRLSDRRRHHVGGAGQPASSAIGGWRCLRPRDIAEVEARKGPSQDLHREIRAGTQGGGAEGIRRSPDGGHRVRPLAGPGW